MRTRDSIEVRGSEIRCSGPRGAPHAESTIRIPSGKAATCPKCGRVYRRAKDWDRLSGASWPQRK